jgi:phosphoribosylformimino-5-aminoimidazole carboxamide ribonucleotide (ProFAR) isomerase
VAAAQEFARQGANYLHVVDLDGAKDGTLANFTAIAEIVRNCDLRVEVGGGIRTEERIKKYYPLDLKSMCREIGVGLEDLISEIIIGPESTQSVSILQDYLRDHGLHELAGHVSFSNCPLRRPPA